MIFNSERVRKERTNWRDQEMSQRHRMWGYNAPCVDIDFLVVEYDRGIPEILIEYKKSNAPYPDNAARRSYNALKILASRAKIPFYIVFYDSELWWFYAFPYNEYAARKDKNGAIAIDGWEGIPMSEREYVSKLNKKSNHEPSDQVKANLTENLPPEVDIKFCKEFISRLRSP